MKWYSILDNTIDFRVNSVNKIEPLVALKNTVEYIMANYPPPYYIMCSGGIDSQAMLCSWQMFGKEYIPVCVKYNENLNYHDIDNIKEYSDNLKINIRYIQFDLLDFLKNQYTDISKTYKCSSPQIATYIAMSKFLDGTPIFGGNYLTGNGLFLTRALLALHNYSLERSLVPYFFLETKEIAYITGFLNLDPIEQHRLRNISAYERSCEIYKHFGLYILPQEKKLTGFEKIKDLYDKEYLNTLSLKQKMKYSSKPSKRAFDIMLRYPFEIYGPEEMDIKVSREFLPNF